MFLTLIHIYVYTKLTCHKETLDQSGNTNNSQQIPPLELLLNQSGSPFSFSKAAPDGRLPLTRTWIYAARTYLHSVKLDSSTDSSELEICVKQTIQSFGTITSSPWMRWLAWPLCVAGIYASKAQRSEICAIMDLVGSFNVFGTMKAAFGIIKTTWQKRDAGERCLDLFTCLSSLGYPALLV